MAAVPDLIAHRGWTSRFPENTLAALRAALDAGARYVEVDVQLSADGEPFLFHDRTLRRMCGVAGAVHERSSRALAALACADRGRFGDRFAHEPVARLSGLVDLLASAPEAFAFVEIKQIAIQQFGAAVVLDRVLPLLEPVRDRVALISFSVPFLSAARRRTSLPLGSVHGRLARWQPSAAVRRIAPEFVFRDVRGLPAEGRLEAGAARLAVYEVADPDDALALAARGVDLVETFAIDEMLQALGTRGGGRA